MNKVRIQFLFLFKAFAALAVLGVVVFFLHRFQVSRQTGALLTRARAAVEADDLPKATRYYQQYIAVRKDDSEARTELAKLYLDAKVPERAFFFYEEALRIDPTLTEARKSIVDAAMEIRRFPDAKLHLKDHLIPASPEDANLYRQLGICEEMLGDFPSAKQYLSKAFELQPGEPKNAAELADLLTRRFNENVQARAALDALVAAAPTNPLAWVARGEYLLQQRNQPTLSNQEVRDELSRAAWSDAQSAIAIAPDDATVASFFALVAVEQKEFAKARDALRNAIAKTPDQPRLYIQLSQVERAESDIEKAIAVLQEGRKNVKEPDQYELLWNESQLQVDAGHLDEVESLVTEMRGLKFSETLLGYLEGRLLFAKGNWLDAKNKFEEFRKQMDRSPEFLKQADYLLAMCQRNLGNPEEEMVALRRCVSADPSWPPAREALATALLRSGQVQQSLSEYNQLVAQANPSTSSVLNYARVLFLDGTSRDAKGNDWIPLKRVLDQLDTIPEAAVDAAILRAELLFYEGKLAEAESLIQSRLETNKESPLLYQALIALQSKEKNWEKVRITLKEAGEELGDTVALRLERARFLILRDREEVDRLQLEQLAAPNEKWSDEEKLELAAGFARVFMALGDTERSKTYANTVAQSAAGESRLSIQLLLFDIALLTDDRELINKALAQIKKIEADGPIWRVGEAIRLNLEAKQAASKTEESRLYDEAIRQLKEAAVARPSWSRIPRLQGEIYDQQPDKDKDKARALDGYLAAINLGEQSPQLISRAMYLLFEKGRFVEADDVIRKLQDQKTPFSTDMMQMASQVSLQLQNYDRALEIANGWAAKSEKAADHIWLAQVYSRSGERSKAEEEFRVAISKDPTAPAPWVSLIQFYTSQKELEAANQALADAEAQIRDEDRDDALAQAYQSMGNLVTAETYYKKALEKNPTDYSILRRYAEFCMRTQRMEIAETELRKIVNDQGQVNDSDRVWARRALALIVGSKGNVEAVKEAKKLLDANDFGPEDKRVYARVLANRSDAISTNEAILYLEEITNKAPVYSLEDNFLLATLYKQKKDWNRYTRTMRAVLGNGGADNVRYVQSYVVTLVERGEDREAKNWSDRLKELAPKELSTVAIDAQLLFRSNDYVRLEELLKKNVGIPGGAMASAQLAESTAQRLESDKKLDQAKPFQTLAEQLYTEISKTDPKRSLALAGYFARLGDMARALKELEGKTLEPNEFGEMIQSALQAPQLSPEGAKLIIPTIQSVVAEHPDDLLLLMGLGDYSSWAGDVPTAKTAYEAALRKNSKFVPALNNLAMILAVTGANVNEAMEAINLAVTLSGPTDYLLDTQGIVRLAAKDLQGAEADLRRSIETEGRADRYFHLALILDAQGKSEEAKEMLDKAEKGGVKNDSLHPIERDAYQKLVTKLVNSR